MYPLPTHYLLCCIYPFVPHPVEADKTSWLPEVFIVFFPTRSVVVKPHAGILFPATSTPSWAGEGMFALGGIRDLPGFGHPPSSRMNHDCVPALPAPTCHDLVIITYEPNLSYAGIIRTHRSIGWFHDDARCALPAWLEVALPVRERFLSAKEF